MAEPSRRRVLTAGMGGITSLALMSKTTRGQGNEPQLLVDRARIVVEEFRGDPNFSGLPVYIQNAYAVLIFPDLLKAGFLVGAEYGNGLMVTREIRSGAWGPPAFFMLVGGSLGLQIGGKISDVIFTVMNDGAVQRILSSRFKLGTDASYAAGPIGAGVGAGTTTQFGEDLYVFARGQGLFGGLTLDGTAILPKDDWNRSFYGQPTTPTAILRDRTVASSGAEGLREALQRF
jgi:lipid-binding SYLF domain-containing protein